MDKAYEAVAARLGATGCDPEEIAQIEADQGVALPATYRAFLRSLGRDAGGLFAGTDVVFPDILGARDGAEEVLSENRAALPSTAVVVYLHQGYVVGFLDPQEGEDPPLREWAETGEAGAPAEVAAPNLLAWLLQAEEASQGHVRSRLAMRNRRSPALAGEPCPRCGATGLGWGTRSFWGPDVPADEQGRLALTADCAVCERSFWRWADDLGLPLLEDG